MNHKVSWPLNPQSSLRDLKLSPDRRLSGCGRSGINGAAAEHCPDWGGDKDLREIFGETLRPGGLEITKEALKILDFKPGSRIADLGCGSGCTLELLTSAGFDAIGLDSSQSLLEEAAGKGETVAGDFHCLPWPTESLDGIFCECSLSLARDPALVLAEGFRVLKKQGGLAVSDLVAKAPGRGGGSGRASGVLEADGLAELIGASGFKIIRRLDYSEALNELGARIVWQLGPEALEKLLGPARNSQGERQRYGYSLIVARKEAE